MYIKGQRLNTGGKKKSKINRTTTATTTTTKKKTQTTKKKQLVIVLILFSSFLKKPSRGTEQLKGLVIGYRAFHLQVTSSHPGQVSSDQKLLPFDGFSVTYMKYVVGTIVGTVAESCSVLIREQEADLLAVTAARLHYLFI